MIKHFESVEEVLADESFQSWYFKESEEKVATWNNWLHQNPSYKSLVDEAVAFMLQLHIKENEVPSGKVDNAYGSLMAKINSIDEQEKPVFHLKNSRRWWWIAAAAVLVISAGLIFWQMTGATETIQTQYGQLGKHQLPDGSEVILNANSTVTLSNGWNGEKDREVWLKGEAFFSVAKTTRKARFIVHTDQLDVVVTGTRFNVSTRDGKTTVYLSEGSVFLNTKDGKQIAMLPGDFVEMRPDLFAKSTGDEESVLAWKDNKLSFFKTPLKDAIKTISEHYGVKVTLGNSELENRTVNGIMPNNNLDVLLQSLEAGMNLKITKTNNEIVISEP